MNLDILRAFESKNRPVLSLYVREDIKLQEREHPEEEIKRKTNVYGWL